MNESTVFGLLLAASAIGPSVRCTEGEMAVVAGIVGLGVSLMLALRPPLQHRSTIWIGIAHATLVGLMAIPSFFFYWHGDAKVNAVLWLAYAAMALWMLLIRSALTLSRSGPGCSKSASGAGTG